MPGLEFLWRAFWELSTDRKIGMAEGPIPWTAMDRWATRHGILDDEEFDRFVLLIKSMDAKYIEYRTADQKKTMGKATGNVGKNGGKHIKTKGMKNS